MSGPRLFVRSLIEKVLKIAKHCLSTTHSNKKSSVDAEELMCV